MAKKYKSPPLTARQKEILKIISDRIVDRGYGPTVREIGDLTGIRSPNGVMCHLKALEKKGHIKREAHLSRGIALVDSPVDRMRKHAKALARAWDKGELKPKNKSFEEKLDAIFKDLRKIA